MKKLGLTILAAALMALPLCAQVATVRADIPFEFVVGDATVAPGQYVIRFLSEPVVQILGHDSYLLPSSPDDAYAVSSEPKLIFHHYGGQYFLSRIATASVSRDFPMTRAERELKKTASAAGQTQQAQTVVVVAKR